jgi:hypothetical protein
MKIGMTSTYKTYNKNYVKNLRTVNSYSVEKHIREHDDETLVSKHIIL